ncbi:SGNH/GDSL hydrolase family protein [Sphingomonas sp. BIUV-7]|uniref:SGNH/GDSL hydrolase family protein n=1 Tax=Sphingomonas natans TaxID=3063330 RepID=A0ABT8Y886_9SPHN|nr:SGNH/GDSL hydrolase family protein [Sphingomonas sp. BIUV-7]MDO6414535.1 SGNH/GDSL hydrolase family protein [Sphingomonas sp. BIUV-7]
MVKIVKRVALGLVVLIVAGVAALIGTVYYQGRQRPSGNPVYVALGSSFAAGLGLEGRAPGSPLACQRSLNGYPQRLARAAGLPLVDMSCSGSTAAQVKEGGQFFQGPQVAAVAPATRYVTLTAGGNDVSYIGDLVGMAYRNRGGLLGLMGKLMHAPHASSERDFKKVEADIRGAIAAARNRAPAARIVVVSYPPALPEHGTCAALGLTADQVALMRPVAETLAGVTRAAAREGGAQVVDMAVIGKGHDACSSEPWVNGAAPRQGAPFHPTLKGTEATARLVARAFGLNPVS